MKKYAVQGNFKWATIVAPEPHDHAVAVMGETEKCIAVAVDNERNSSKRFDDLIAQANLTADAVSACERLMEQFNAYLNGWTGAPFPKRIGLPSDMQFAQSVIDQAREIDRLPVVPKEHS